MIRTNGNGDGKLLMRTKYQPTTRPFTPTLVLAGPTFALTVALVGGVPPATRGPRGLHRSCLART